MIAFDVTPYSLMHLRLFLLLTSSERASERFSCLRDHSGGAWNLGKTGPEFVCEVWYIDGIENHCAYQNHDIECRG